MKAPTQEQLKDPEWWDENDPLGYSGTLFVVQKASQFARLQWHAGQNRELRLEGLEVAKRYDRPTKPQAPEWDDNIPLVGCKCLHGGSGQDEKVTVIAHAYSSRTGKLIVFQREADETISSSSPMYFRPIRTKEQRQRDEVAGCIVGHSVLQEWEALEVARALYDAGLLRKGE